jgi:hypothetical protein
MAKFAKDNKQVICRMIRCKKTRRYFTGDGWTHNASQAKTFAEQIDAVEACIQHELVDIELVLGPAGTETELFTCGIR